MTDEARPPVNPAAVVVAIGLSGTFVALAAIYAHDVAASLDIPLVPSIAQGPAGAVVGILAGLLLLHEITRTMAWSASGLASALPDEGGGSATPTAVTAGSYKIECPDCDGAPITAAAGYCPWCGNDLERGETP